MPVRDTRSRRADEEDVGRDRLHGEPQFAGPPESVLDTQGSLLDGDGMLAGDLLAFVATSEGIQCVPGIAWSAALSQYDPLASKVHSTGDVVDARTEHDAELGRNRRPVVVTVSEYSSSLAVEKDRVAQGLPAKDTV